MASFTEDPMLYRVTWVLITANYNVNDIHLVLHQFETPQGTGKLKRGKAPSATRCYTASTCELQLLAVSTSASCSLGTAGKTICNSQVPSIIALR